MAGMLASQGVKSVLGPQPPQRLHFQAPAVSTQVASQPFEAFKESTANNLFQVEVGGLKKEVVDQVASDTGDLAAQISHLTLIGVYQGATKLAMIADQSTGEQGAFLKGETVFEGPGVIKAIKGDLDQAQVLLSQGNKELWLSLGDEIVVASVPKSYAKTRAAQETKKKTAPAVKANTKNGKDFFLSSEDVDAQLNNLPTLLNQARVIPYFKDGKNEGYIIKAIDKGSLYEKLGLQNNDVIQKINGQTIDSPEKAFSLLKMLRTERNISLSLKRAKAPKTLVYHIN